MRLKLVVTGALVGIFAVPLLAIAADADTGTGANRSRPMMFVQDSIITTKVKMKLAEERMGSLVHIKVETDNKGAVWLSGTARTQADVDKAISIAHATEGVTAVTSDIHLKKDD